MILLFVAIIAVHLPNGFSSIKLQSFDAAGAHFGQPGYETDLLYLTSLLALCFGGPGPFSVDGWLNRLMGKHRVVGNKSSEKVARKSVAPKKANGSQFFAEQAVTELESWSDFRLEEVGCPTEPIRWGSVSDRVSISWAKVFAALGAELKAPSSVVFYACAELRSKRLTRTVLYVSAPGAHVRQQPGSEVHTCACPQAWLNQRQLSDKGINGFRVSQVRLPVEDKQRHMTTSAGRNHGVGVGDLIVRSKGAWFASH